MNIFRNTGNAVRLEKTLYFCVTAGLKVVNMQSFYKTLHQTAKENESTASPVVNGPR
jgi:hypothetical protein